MHTRIRDLFFLCYFHFSCIIFCPTNYQLLTRSRMPNEVFKALVLKIAVANYFRENATWNPTNSVVDGCVAKTVAKVHCMMLQVHTTTILITT